MILLKIFNLICVGLILSTSIVDGKGKIASGKKSGTSKSHGSTTSSKSYGSTTSNSYGKSHTTSTSHRATTSRPIVKQTARPVDTSRYPTQPPYNPHYRPETHHPSNTHTNFQKPHYSPPPKSNFPQTHYKPPPPTHYPQHNYANWGNNKPQKSHVGRNIATHAMAGLGGAYIGHQIGKHNSWYDKRRAERERERERERKQDREQGTHSGSYRNRTNNLGLDTLKPITPFKVNDISRDFDEQKHATGNGLMMWNDVHNRYNNDPQKNEISKAADANAYLNMKLRPSKSETIPKKNYTTEQLQGMMRMSGGGGGALMGGVLGAAAAGQVLPGLVIPNVFNQTGAGLQPSSNASMTTDPNSQNPFSPLVPSLQAQPNFAITGGQSILQTNQTPTAFKIPLTDPQVLPLVMKQLETDEKLERKSFPKRRTSGSSSMYTISNALILISIVAFNKF